jgi:hypothetical protein
MQFCEYMLLNCVIETPTGVMRVINLSNFITYIFVPCITEFVVIMFWAPSG